MRIIHTADWHLTDVQMGLRERGDDFTRACMAVVDLAATHDVGVVANCGDLFNVARPSARKLADLQAIDGRLASHGITMYTITGNHDRSTPSWVDVARCENIINLDDSTLTTDGVSFTGLPYMPTPQLRSELGRLDGGDILMLHCAVKELMGFPSQDALSLDDLPTDRYAAILLGDIHVHSYVEIDGCHVGYPGSIETISRAEDFEKQVAILDIEGGVVSSRTSVGLDNRAVLELVINTEEDIAPAMSEVDSFKGRRPIVYLQYAQDMRDVKARIRSRLDDDAILKPIPIPRSPEGKGVTPGEGDMGDVRPEDFVVSFFPKEQALGDLALECCHEGGDAGVAIADYIARRVTGTV